MRLTSLAQLLIESRAIRSSRGRAAPAARLARQPKTPPRRTVQPDQQNPRPVVSAHISGLRHGVTVAEHRCQTPQTRSLLVAPLALRLARLPPSVGCRQSSPSPASPEAASAPGAHGGRLRQVRRRGNERLPTLTPLSCSSNPLAPPPPPLLTDLAAFTFSQVLEAFGVDRTKGLTDTQVLI